jgi:hypothetical protein
MRVGVKFCGNCNPLVDMGAILRQLSAQSGNVSFVSWSDENYVVLLVLSSCGRDCATRPVFDGPVIAVTDTTVDRRPVAVDELPAAIQTAICAQGGDPDQPIAPCERSYGGAGNSIDRNDVMTERNPDGVPAFDFTRAPMGPA